MKLNITAKKWAEADFVPVTLSRAPFLPLELLFVSI